MDYKCLSFLVSKLQKIISKQISCPCPSSYIRHTAKGVTLKPKQKPVWSTVITKMITYNLELSDWYLVLDNEASNV